MKKLIPFIIIAFTISCTVQKDRRALNRVKSNITLLDNAFYAGLKLHPCANETSVLILRDTLITVKTDTITNKGITDTIYIKTTKVITLTDTIQKTIVDRQMVGILTDSLNAEKRKGSFKDGQLIEKDKKIKDQGKKETKLWIVFALLLAVIGVCIYDKFKPKIK